MTIAQAAPGTKVVLLGTAGGPWPSRARSGISQAVVVDGRAHVVDCGAGSVRQLLLAGWGQSLQLGDVLLTHLHSDHSADYFNLFLLGWARIQRGVARRGAPIHVYGPGPAGGLAALPGAAPGGGPVPVANPTNPTPGLVDHTAYQMQAHAYDLNVRMRDADRAELATLMALHEIGVPDEVGACGPDKVSPPMEPVVVKEDDQVRVSAVLVEHPPVFPSFAYRFDTAGGSVVISGDTCPTPNLVDLARGADVLVHEVVDTDHLREGAATVAPSAWVDLGARLEHIFRSHTSLTDVGRVASEAGVGKLVLSHFVPADGVPDERWLEGARANFDGEVVVGRDLLTVEV